MRSRRSIAALLLGGVLTVGIPPSALAQAEGQATARPAEPLFVRWTVYPTASLSRYDFNNDLDLYELRVYAEVRRGSQEGRPATDATVTAMGEKLDFRADHFEKRIAVRKDALPEEIALEVALPDRPPLRERPPLPSWLILEEPLPAIYDAKEGLAIRWRFSRFDAPVDVNAYDFKSGQQILGLVHVAGKGAAIDGAKLPASTIVRIWAIQSWLYKRFLGGPGYARGSEIQFIPWSQVFVRTR